MQISSRLFPIWPAFLLWKFLPLKLCGAAQSSLQTPRRPPCVPTTFAQKNCGRMWLWTQMLQTESIPPEGESRGREKREREELFLGNGAFSRVTKGDQRRSTRQKEWGSYLCPLLRESLPQSLNQGVFSSKSMGDVMGFSVDSFVWVPTCWRLGEPVLGQELEIMKCYQAVGNPRGLNNL